MKPREKLWMDTFSAVWASTGYNPDASGLAMVQADEALAAFDERFKSPKAHSVYGKEWVETLPLGTE